jgi:hypothetical protein
MENILKEINKNIDKLGKKSYNTDLEFISTKTEISCEFVVPIEIETAEIGFKALYTYYSIPNVSKHNNAFKFIVGTDSYTIILPDGAYEVEQIGQYIENYIKSTFLYTNEISKDPKNNNNNDIDLPDFSIKPVDSTGKAVIEISKNCSVDFTVNNSIGALLGFSKRILQSGIHYSDNLVNIVPVNSISVCVKVNNLDVYGSLVNGDISNRIYTFFPDVQPGEKINEVVENKVFYPIDRVKKIQNMTVSLIDQNGNFINNRDEDITLILTLNYSIP